MKDLETLEKRKEKIVRAAKTGDKQSIAELSLLEIIIKSLNDGVNIKITDFNDDSIKIIKSMSLLSLKPVLYVCNVNEQSIKNPSNELISLIDSLKKTGSSVITLASKKEEEINE